MEKEKWYQWRPIEKIPKRIWLQSLIDNNKDGLSLTFENEDGNIRIIISFGYSALSYRNTDEGNLLSTIHHWGDNYGKEFFDWGLYKTQNSSYIEWLKEESCGKYDDIVEHYVFITPDDVVEVLSLYPPNITIEHI